MGGTSRTFFHDLVLRPVSCITKGCRPPRRRGNPTFGTSSKAHWATAIETPNPTSDLRKQSDNESYPVDNKTQLFGALELQAFDQPECSLLSDLPAEVRVMIYDYVLCTPVPVVHIVRRKDGTLCHVRCRASKGECGTYRCYNEYSELSRSTKEGSRTRDSDLGNCGTLLSLLVSCKKIYAEAIDILYSGNAFSFFDLPLLDDFTSKIPQRRLNAIQYIQFEYKLYSIIRHFYPSLAPALGENLTWGKVRQILSGLEGLKEIRAKVAKPPEPYGNTGEVIRITDFVADRTDGACDAIRRLLGVENVRVIVEEIY